MRRRTALLVLMLLTAPLAAQSPAPSAPAPAPLEVPYRQFQLANGLNVILHQDKTVPVVAVNVWYHVGSANEKPGRTGFAHLFEHLMFEGSKNVKEGQFDILLEAAGANNNGSTTSSDIIYLVNYVFKGGPPPLPVVSEGDVNCSATITSSDVIFLVNYVFKGGPTPVCP